MPLSHVAAPQGVPPSAGTHVPGDPVQVKHSAHAGTHAHDPQSTARPQLLVTLPHLLAQVVPLASGVQTGVCVFFFFFFFFFSSVT